MQELKNIIFDYGNVIFKLDFFKSQLAWQNLGINDFAEFYSHQKQDPIFDEFEKGGITTHDFRVYIRKILNNPYLTDEQIDNAWNSLLEGIPEGNHELLLKLKTRYRTFLLSNINPIHYEYITKYLKDRFGLNGNDSLFEKVYYSHLMGRRKPDTAIFEQVLQENNLKAEETLFIDDSPQHIEGAKKTGIRTYLMTAPDNVQDLFKKLDLNTYIINHLSTNVKV